MFTNSQPTRRCGLGIPLRSGRVHRCRLEWPRRNTHTAHSCRAPVAGYRRVVAGHCTRAVGDRAGAVADHAGTCLARALATSRATNRDVLPASLERGAAVTAVSVGVRCGHRCRLTHGLRSVNPLNTKRLGRPPRRQPISAAPAATPRWTASGPNPHPYLPFCTDFAPETLRYPLQVLAYTVHPGGQEPHPLCPMGGERTSRRRGSPAPRRLPF